MSTSLRNTDHRPPAPRKISRFFPPWHPEVVAARSNFTPITIITAITSITTVTSLSPLNTVTTITDITTSTASPVSTGPKWYQRKNAKGLTVDTMTRV